ncbi:MAG: hypothetical protein ACR5KV_01485 [Wolbachia sp.]
MPKFTQKFNQMKSGETPILHKSSSNIMECQVPNFGTAYVDINRCVHRSPQNSPSHSHKSTLSGIQYYDVSEFKECIEKCKVKIIPGHTGYDTTYYAKCMGIQNSPSHSPQPTLGEELKAISDDLSAKSAIIVYNR